MSAFAVDLNRDLASINQLILVRYTRAGTNLNSFGSLSSGSSRRPGSSLKARPPDVERRLTRSVGTDR